MDNSASCIDWLDPDKFSEKIQAGLNAFSLSRIGVCTVWRIALAERDGIVVCPDIIDGMCSNHTICPFGAQPADDDEILFLCGTEISSLLRSSTAADDDPAPVDAVSSRVSAGNPDQRFLERAYAKLKFEVTRKVAAETSDIAALGKALREEFGLLVIPRELTAVFELEVNKNAAKAAGISYAEYLIRQSGAKS